MSDPRLTDLVRQAGDGFPVGPAPIDTLRTARGRHATWSTLAVAAVTVLFIGLVSGLVFLQMGDKNGRAETGQAVDSPTGGHQQQSSGLLDPAGWNRAQVVAYLAEKPGIALILPDTLPAGYTWEGPIYQGSDTVGRVSDRTSVFTMDGNREDPRIYLCSEEAEVACSFTDGSSIERKAGDLRVVFTVRGGSDEAEKLNLIAFLETVKLTTAVDVTWLP